MSYPRRLPLGETFCRKFPPDPLQRLLVPCGSSRFCKQNRDEPQGVKSFGGSLREPFYKKGSLSAINQSFLKSLWRRCLTRAGCFGGLYRGGSGRKGVNKPAWRGPTPPVQPKSRITYHGAWGNVGLWPFFKKVSAGLEWTRQRWRGRLFQSSSGVLLSRFSGTARRRACPRSGGCLCRSLR